MPSADAARAHSGVHLLWASDLAADGTATAGDLLTGRIADAEESDPTRAEGPQAIPADPSAYCAERHSGWDDIHRQQHRLGWDDAADGLCSAPPAGSFKLSVPGEQPRHLLPDVTPIDLRPPGPAGALQQVRGGEHAAASV